MKQPILYIKPGCPWCRQARAFLDKNAVAYDLKDVTASKQSNQRMIEISGQSLTPTLEYGEFVCADFSVDELIDALAENPEVRASLGLGEHFDEN